MSSILIAEVALLLGLTMVFTYVAFQMRFGNVATKKIVGQQSIGIVLILLLVLGFARLLPDEWQWASSWLSSLTTALGMWAAFLIFSFVRGKSGTLLAQIPRYTKMPGVLLGLLGLMVVWLLWAEVSFSKDVLRTVSSIAFWISVVVLMFLTNRQSALITDTGFYHFNTILKWQQVKSYEWTAQLGGVDILVLELKRRPRLLRFTALRIPSQYKEALEEILASRVAAQPDVQPHQEEPHDLTLQ